MTEFRAYFITRFNGVNLATRAESKVGSMAAAARAGSRAKGYIYI